MSLRNRKTTEKPSADSKPLIDRVEQQEESTMESFGELLQQTRNSFKSGKTRDVKFRRRQLEAMMQMYVECEDQMVEALRADLGRPRQESIIFDVNVMKNELRNILYNLNSWTAPKKPAKGVANIFDDVIIYKEPYGVALIIGAWNYPIMLNLVPMASAIAAGNCVILKPSEISVHSSKLLMEIIPKYLDKDCFKVVCGGVEETTEILRHQFDFIFYTGSTRVGQIVHAAANKFLTPVTLELGGKSPCYIDDSVDLGYSMRRLLWGKNSNAGQTCIAPDYILCTKEVEGKFIEEFKAVIKEWYGEDVQQSPDYARIATDANFKRLVSFLDNATIASGGRFDPSDRFIEPTLLTNVQSTDPIMREEIFGPILPIIIVRDVFEAVDFINEREKPLSMYIFTTNNKDRDLIINNTSAGTICVNDTVVQFAVLNIPFGGIGMSGMGSYHGKQGFKTFTHEKGCLDKCLYYPVEKLGCARYPPYSDLKTLYLSIMLRKFWFSPSVSYRHIFSALLGVGLTVFAHYLLGKYD